MELIEPQQLLDIQKVQTAGGFTNALRWITIKLRLSLLGAEQGGETVVTTAWLDRSSRHPTCSFPEQAPPLLSLFSIPWPLQG